MVDRIRRFNPFHGTQMQDHYNGWPTPANAIGRNSTARGIKVLAINHAPALYLT